MGTSYKQPFTNHTNNHGNSIQTTLKQHHQSFTWTAMNKKHGAHLHFTFSGVAVTTPRHQHTPKLKFVVNVDIVGWVFIIPHYSRAIGSCICNVHPMSTMLRVTANLVYLWAASKCVLFMCCFVINFDACCTIVVSNNKATTNTMPYVYACIVVLLMCLIVAVLLFETTKQQQKVLMLCYFKQSNNTTTTANLQCFNSPTTHQPRTTPHTAQRRINCPLICCFYVFAVLMCNCCTC